MRLTTLPEPHQWDAVQFLTSRKRSLVAYATGTGKSYCQLVSALSLLKSRHIDRFIAVGTPNSCIELHSDCIEFLDHVPFTIESEQDLKEFFKSDNPIGIMKYSVLNPENVDYFRHYFEDFKVGVSFDEFHLLANPETKRTDTYYQLSDLYEFCFGVTATAITTKLDNLYSLIDFLIPNYFGSFDTFCDYYIQKTLKTIKRGRFTKKVWDLSKYKNLDNLEAWLKPVLISFYPDYQFEYRKIKGTLFDEDRYYEAAEGFFRPKKVSKKEKSKAKSHSARLVDLQHVVNSDPNKLKLFREEVLKQHDRGVLVYCTHYETLNLLEEQVDALEIDHRRITGKCTKKKRTETKAWFTEDSAGKVLFITTGGGQSLNLQSTNRLIFYDVPFGIGKYIQILGRVARYFSSYKIFEITYIVMEDTVDEYKFSYLEHNYEPVVAVLKNRIGASSELPPYNGYVLSKLRRKLLWKRKADMKWPTTPPASSIA